MRQEVITAFFNNTVRSSPFRTNLECMEYCELQCKMRRRGIELSCAIAKAICHAEEKVPRLKIVALKAAQVSKTLFSYCVGLVAVYSYPPP